MTPQAPDIAVIFDFDGVLADTERLHLRATQDALAPHGWVLDDRAYYDRYLGYGDRDLIVELARDRGAALTEALLHEIMEAKAALYREHLAAGSALFATAAPCIERLG